MTTIEESIAENAGKTAEQLSVLLSGRDEDFGILNDAMRYSALAGGKRIRPFLVSAFSELFGGNATLATRFGCALEMIHTYSLIHDDLPCMDDDDLRRGKPTNHKVFGEATAMLAGDALLTFAFETVSAPEIPADIAVRAVRLLAGNAGMFGMIGGQMMDLRGETEAFPLETLLKVHAKKTGALMEAACLLGCLSAGITDENDPRYLAAKAYADGIGLAFQIVDDRLDVIGDTATLGKPVGSDKEEHKTTFLTFFSPEEAFAYATAVTEKAKSAISPYDGHERLSALADYLLNRRK